MTHKPNKLNKESQHFYIPIPIRNRFKKNPHNASVSFVRNVKTLFYFIVITRHYIVLLRFDQITRLTRLQSLAGTSCYRTILIR